MSERVNKELKVDVSPGRKESAPKEMPAHLKRRLESLEAERSDAKTVSTAQIPRTQV